MEQELGIDTYAVNWPIGCGKEFQGVYDREKQRILLLQARPGARRSTPPGGGLDDPALDEMIGAKGRHQLPDEVELLGGRPGV